VKNNDINIKDRLVAKYLVKDNKDNQPKSTNINILLNRVKTNQKNETRKKVFFSAMASTGILLFGLIIF